MDNTIKDILSIWGALLSTALGILQFIKHNSDKPKISVTANLTYSTCSEEDSVKGTKVLDDHNSWHEVLINIGIINRGNKAIQISAVILETENENNIRYEMRIIPNGFPVVLNPLCSVDVNIQKEWIDYENVTCFGVVDGVGGYHCIPKETFHKLWLQSNNLPSNKKKYVRKDNPKEVVMAFQQKDKGILVRKA